MARKQKGYFHYNIPESVSHLLGETKSQIIETLEHYKQRSAEPIGIPDESEIKKVPGARITCGFPMMHSDHFLEARVGDIIFDVNANAYEWIQSTSQNYERLRRGGLYKFQTLGLFGLWFLPEAVMQGLKGYDWAQHKAQVDEWLGIREETQGQAENRGYVRRG
ncbi:MAG TPA: hypothetical protein HA362_02795 [Nanoarchaeota archaeon]|nr:hypothetical protein [Nanoarchaeota archaeon]